MESIRTFVAVLLPGEVVRCLEEVVVSLAKSDADVKWSSSGNFHITLQFLGNVELHLTDTVCNAVKEAASVMGSFDAEVSGIGAFPNIRRPRVVWAGISSGRKEFRHLTGRVADSLERIGFSREARAFSPHVTLGRARSMQGMDNLQRIMEQMRDVEAGAFRVNKVSVMKSELNRTGAVYSEISSFELSGL